MAAGTNVKTSNKPRVLVVEDEPILLMSALDMIEDAGFDPIPARSADEAICILEQNNDIRIVFTDVDMPGSMDGLKLANAVRDRWPPVEIIVVSGHVNVKPDDLPSRGEFFKKPYQPDKIIETMRRFVA